MSSTLSPACVRRRHQAFAGALVLLTSLNAVASEPALQFRAHSEPNNAWTLIAPVKVSLEALNEDSDSAPSESIESWNENSSTGSNYLLGYLVINAALVAGRVVIGQVFLEQIRSVEDFDRATSTQMQHRDPKKVLYIYSLPQETLLFDSSTKLRTFAKQRFENLYQHHPNATFRLVGSETELRTTLIEAHNNVLKTGEAFDRIEFLQHGKATSLYYQKRAWHRLWEETTELTHDFARSLRSLNLQVAAPNADIRICACDTGASDKDKALAHGPVGTLMESISPHGASVVASNRILAVASAQELASHLRPDYFVEGAHLLVGTGVIWNSLKLGIATIAAGQRVRERGLQSTVNFLSRFHVPVQTRPPAELIPENIIASVVNHLQTHSSRFGQACGSLLNFVRRK